MALRRDEWAFCPDEETLELLAKNLLENGERPTDARRSWETECPCSCPPTTAKQLHKRLAVHSRDKTEASVDISSLFECSVCGGPHDSCTQANSPTYVGINLADETYNHRRTAVDVCHFRELFLLFLVFILGDAYCINPNGQLRATGDRQCAVPAFIRHRNILEIGIVLNFDELPFVHQVTRLRIDCETMTGPIQADLSTAIEKLAYHGSSPATKLGMGRQVRSELSRARSRRTPHIDDGWHCQTSSTRSYVRCHSNIPTEYGPMGAQLGRFFVGVAHAVEKRTEGSSS
ncbi:hypothetical protein PC9H_010453 [Pleurotus ostreatus]|uniref:Uncharacterized protein n=1 Tax=Pleurotus ostreatus TaxID=5322 RepID=A0A8H6ZJS0_PLEOS|nr:uncharacterized protein PC9H_010453 [Pleurotus ostreatus]KAF7422297.1 hypothetical protein PC9H_010453 [Pleurotus ostreatus]